MEINPFHNPPPFFIIFIFFVPSRICRKDRIAISIFQKKKKKPKSFEPLSTLFLLDTLQQCYFFVFRIGEIARQIRLRVSSSVVNQTTFLLFLKKKRNPGGRAVDNYCLHVRSHVSDSRRGMHVHAHVSCANVDGG